MIAIALILLAAATAQAQEVGTIAATDGVVEIGRSGTWSTAKSGATIQVGEAVRTGEAARAHLLLRDNSVLSVADNSEIEVSAQQLDPGAGPQHSSLKVIRGKVKALVSDEYHQPGASYQIETATAVATIHGTELVIVFDPVADTTQVAVVSGNVEVHGVIDRLRNGVMVTSHELTTVARGQLPTAPTPIEDSLFRQLLDGLSFLPSGQGDGLATAPALLAGESMPSSDRAEALPAPPSAAGEAPQVITTEGAALLEGAAVLEQAGDGGIDQPPQVLDQIQDQLGDLGVRL